MTAERGIRHMLVKTEFDSGLLGWMVKAATLHNILLQNEIAFAAFLSGAGDTVYDPSVKERVVGRRLVRSDGSPLF